MNDGFNHLIAVHGVLITFSIARRVSKKDIKKISDKIKKQCKTTDEFNALLQQEVMAITKNSIDKDLIPGLVVPTENKKQTGRNELADEKRLMQFTYMANTIAKKLLDNKLTKDEICYTILILLNSLGLSDKDFTEFNRKYGDIDENNEEENNEGDDDDADPF